MNCRICQSTDVSKLFSGLTDLEYDVPGRFNFYQCGTCQTIFLFPTPTIEELLSFHPDTYHGYNTPVSKLTQFLIKLNLKNRSRLYKKIIGSEGEILDIGSADGHHFTILKKFGNWQFSGIEFNDRVAQLGRKKGFNIETSTIETSIFPKGKFDLIIMNHLIEHVTDPNETLKAASALLKKDGYLIGETPNIASLDFYLTRQYWGGLHTPRHTFLFNPKGLKVLFEQNGFKLKQISHKLDTSHWALSLQNFLQSKNITKTKLKLGRTFYYPFLLLMLLPLNMIQKIFRATGIIQFICQKS